MDQNQAHGVPGANDTAVVPFSDVTVGVSSSVNLGALNNSGTLHLTSGTLVLSQASTTSGLNFDGGTLTVGSSLLISQSFNWAQGVLNGVGTTTVGPAATMVFDGSNATCETDGNLIISAASASLPLPPGAPANVTIKNAGGLTINSQLTLNIASLVNTGVVNVNGVFAVNYSGVQNSGTININDSAQFNLQNCSTTLSGPIVTTAASSRFTETDALSEFSGGTLAINAGGALNGPGTFSFSGNWHYGLPGISINTDVNVQNLSLSGGALNISKTLTVGNSLNWTNGGAAFGSGSMIIGSKATATLNGNGVGSTQYSLGPQFHFENDGILSITTSYFTGSEIFNKGTFNSLGNLFQVTLNNSGKFDANVIGTEATIFRQSTYEGTGTFSANANVQFQGGNITFQTPVNIANNVSVQFLNTTDPTTLEFAAGSGVSGPGNLVLNASLGTYTVDAQPGGSDFQASNLQLLAGNLILAGGMTVSGTFLWSGGSIQGSGELTVATGANFAPQGAGQSVSLGVNVNNFGTTTLTKAGGINFLNGVTFNNKPGGTFQALSDAPLSGAGVFNNQGLFIKDTENSVGSDIHVSFLTSVGSEIDVNDGILTSDALTNSGLIRIAGGATLYISQNFTQDSSGNLNITEDGTPPLLPPLYTGTSTLGGSLVVNSPAGFTPPTGAVYPIVTFKSSTGQFASVVVPTSGGRPLFLTKLTPTSFELLSNTPLATPGKPALLLADDSGVKGDGITNVKQPHLTGTSIAGDTIQIVNGAGTVLGSAKVASDGTYSVQFAQPLADGTYPVSVQVVNNSGATSAPSPVFQLKILTAIPATPAAPKLLPADDSGLKGDGITNVKQPHLTGTSVAGDIIQILSSTGTVLGSATVASDGSYSMAFAAPLPLGSLAVRVQVIDVAANASSASAPFTLTIVSKDVASETSDFDGVGKSELAVFRSSTGQWFIQNPVTGSQRVVSFGDTDLRDIPVPGDYDGIGRTEFAIFRPSTGQWFIQNPVTGGQRVVSFGDTDLRDIPVPGDYDGIGRTELAIFRPSTGQWFILNPLTGSQRVMSFGDTSLRDVPVPGDYDGVGQTELAVFRTSTAQWFILNPVTGSQRVVSFGDTNLRDVPVPGDYDGDGKTDVGVFRPSTAQWIVKLSDGGYLSRSFGATGLSDVPLEAPIGSLVKLGLAGGVRARSADVVVDASPSTVSASSFATGTSVSTPPQTTVATSWLPWSASQRLPLRRGVLQSVVRKLGSASVV